MEFTDRIRSTLSPAERQALSDAVEQVDDFLVAELVELYHETGPAAVPVMFSDQFLPDRYVDFYDFTMTKRLYACVLVVAGRLQDGWEPPRCRGEELVLRAVLDHAETCLEETTGEPTTTFFDRRDLLFERLDHGHRLDRDADSGKTLEVELRDTKRRLAYGSNCPGNWGLFHEKMGKGRITIYELVGADGRTASTDGFRATARPIFGFGFEGLGL
jgi:hypothetical protein